jgi:hypothetical protein
VTFASSLPLIVASTVLVLSMLIALPLGVVTPMSSVSGLLQGSNRSVHFSYLVVFIIRPMP